MYFIGGGGGRCGPGCPFRRQYPRAAKNPLKPPPPKPPLFLNLALGGFKHDIRFPRNPPPPLWDPGPPPWVRVSIYKKKVLQDLGPNTHTQRPQYAKKF